MPIFCYLCSMVNHDENDCLVGLCHIERLNSKDKPFGPWMKATQERLQKPQLTLAPSRDSDRETQRNAVILAQPAMVMDSSLRSAVEGGHAQTAVIKDNKGGKADMESDDAHIVSQM